MQYQVFVYRCSWYYLERSDVIEVGSFILVPVVYSSFSCKHRTKCRYGSTIQCSNLQSACKVRVHDLVHRAKPTDNHATALNLKCSIRIRARRYLQLVYSIRRVLNGYMHGGTRTPFLSTFSFELWFCYVRTSQLLLLQVLL